MIPVLSSDQMRQAEARTIELGTTEATLMERAAARCVECILGTTRTTRPVLVVAGMGNNGGDGLAIARQLAAAGRPVRVWVVRHRKNASTGFEREWMRAQQAGIPMLDVPIGSAMPGFTENELIVDALLGIGLGRPVDGLVADVIAAVNASHCEVVAVDVPSGLRVDVDTVQDGQHIVRAQHTFTFETPKPALLIPDLQPFIGRLHVLPIGLDQDFMSGLNVKGWWVEASDAAALMPDRPRTGHKGTFGHAMLVAGGPGKFGAALMAVQAALRSGVGLVTGRIPAAGASLMHQQAPEALISEDPAACLMTWPEKIPATAVAIGPGMGTEEGTGRLLKRFIQEGRAPLVLDADAINLLAINPTWGAFLPAGSILTPHPKEFDRWLGPSSNGTERLQKARDFAARQGVVVVLKGHPTAICSPNGTVVFNSTGNAGMAKGGSGDVLTGIITAIRAQGLAPVEAAVLGVYAHGAAGDLAAAAVGQDGMTPLDLIRHLPQAWSDLRGTA
jgi:ADP-dependent NAD(P)H-hydrate dehydratase / NAD(P)H-hydrate epimerase